MPERSKGLFITFFGVLAITPDGLLVRLVSADEWTTLFWRGLLTAFSICVVLSVLHRGRVTARFRAIGQTGLWLAFLFAGGAICFVMAVSLTKVANVLFIVSSTPLFAAIISRVFLGESVPTKTWTAIAFAMAGIAIITSGSLAGGEASLLGDGITLLAALSLAVTLCLARKARGRSMVPAMAVAGLIYAVIALPFCAPFDVSPDDALWLALMGLVSVPLGFSLLTLAPRYLPAPEVGLLLLLEAVLGPLLVWWILAESPGIRGLAGGGVVIATLFVLNVTAMTETAK